MPPNDPAQPYRRETVEALEAAIVSRGLIVPETGSGKDDAVVKDDLIAVLVAADGNVRPSTPEEVGRPPLAEVAQKRAAERAEHVRVIGAAAEPQEAR